MTYARDVFALTGPDTEHFLQGLVTNDLAGLSKGLVYAAILTPQGKYLVDFFLMQRNGTIFLDVASELADGLLTRLSMYKLRADVTIDRTDLHVHRGIGAAPEGAFDDPRHSQLGWRAYLETPQASDMTDWDAIRVAHCIPETGIELGPDTYILEAGFERLNGVDFRKGCYVGQEVTARMKHKTELRKGLAKVTLDGQAPIGTKISRDGKDCGVLFTQANGQAIAYLRFDRAGTGMVAGDAAVSWEA
ncbi:folate-binding protein YgfZ [Shimia litoralis]|uniref:Folate-binding protein YgfZ n=1 Tax=Shimia litoralis TaxID=420403 RepID=A0A4U7N414_9RHOB|nr:folate-binding protein YgfZ [Shimia litoralis]TKZ20512.1 folate-binding protein YgfZ [Shimia litoralis]